MGKIKIKLDKKQCILCMINGIFIMAFLLLTFLSKNAVKDLYSQQEAKRWESEEGSYAQVSGFFSPDRNMQESEIEGIRNSIMETLSNDSFEVSGENVRLWIDAYSGECQKEVRKDNRTVSVTAVGVGNDFFQFHPLKLRSGGYISGNDLNHDRIVVDEGFAWSVFGSNDIIGMYVWIDEKPFVIAGVVAVEEDTLWQAAYGENNRIYVLYDKLKQLESSGQAEGMEEDGLRITCYEAVLPNPISNYACSALQTALGLSNEIEEDASLAKDKDRSLMNFGDCEVIENTKRYENLELLSNMKNMKFESMRTNHIAYPYWENIAKVIEGQQQRWLIFRILLLIFPFICLILWIYDLWKNKMWTTKDILMGIVDKIQEKMEEKREHESEEEEQE